MIIYFKNKKCLIQLACISIITVILVKIHYNIFIHNFHITNLIQLSQFYFGGLFNEEYKDSIRVIIFIIPYCLLINWFNRIFLTSIKENGTLVFTRSKRRIHYFFMLTLNACVFMVLYSVISFTLVVMIEHPSIHMAEIKEFLIVMFLFFLRNLYIVLVFQITYFFVSETLGTVITLIYLIIPIVLNELGESCNNFARYFMINRIMYNYQNGIMLQTSTSELNYRAINGFPIITNVVYVVVVFLVLYLIGCIRIKKYQFY